MSHRKNNATETKVEKIWKAVKGPPFSVFPNIENYINGQGGDPEIYNNYINI